MALFKIEWEKMKLEANGKHSKSALKNKRIVKAKSKKLEEIYNSLVN